jgi:predicted metalloprotease
MRWTPGRRSPDLEDRRATTGGRRIGIPLGGGGLGLGGILILLVLSFIFKTDLLSLFGGGGPAVQVGVPGAKFEPTPEEESSWISSPSCSTTRRGRGSGSSSRAGRNTRTPSSWSTATPPRRAAATAMPRRAPSTAPADSTVYIDLNFYKELKDRFGAPGDFAQAYVLAHEIGHHVQNLLGVSDQVHNAQEGDPSGPTPCRCAWSCRRTATPGCGGTPPSAATSWSRERWTRR